MDTELKFEITSQNHVILTRRMELEDFKKQYPESYEFYLEEQKKKN